MRERESRAPEARKQLAQAESEGLEAWDSWIKNKILQALEGRQKQTVDLGTLWRIKPSKCLSLLFGKQISEMRPDSDFLSITLCPKELAASESESGAVLNAHSFKTAPASGCQLKQKQHQEQLQKATPNLLPQIDSDERGWSGNA